MFTKIREGINNHLYRVLWIALAVEILAAGVLSAVDFDRFGNAVAALVALQGFNIAALGWVWTGLTTIEMTQRTNALNLLARLSDETVIGWKSKVYPYIKDFAEWYADGSLKGEARPEFPKDEAERLLGLYEQLAVAVYKNIACAETMSECQSLVFKRLYVGLRHHIDKIQEDDRSYFENFVNLTLEWNPDLKVRSITLDQRRRILTPSLDVPPNDKL